MTMTLDDIDLASQAFWTKPGEERDAAFSLLRKHSPVPWSGPAESGLLPPEENLAAAPRRAAFLSSYLKAFSG